MSQRVHRSSRSRWFLIYLWMWAAIWAATLETSYAQVVSASLSGRVADPAGVYVLVANIIATNAGTGRRHSLQ